LGVVKYKEWILQLSTNQTDSHESKRV